MHAEDGAGTAVPQQRDDYGAVNGHEPAIRQWHASVIGDTRKMATRRSAGRDHARRRRLQALTSSPESGCARRRSSHSLGCCRAQTTRTEVAAPCAGRMSRCAGSPLMPPKRRVNQPQASGPLPGGSGDDHAWRRGPAAHDAAVRHHGNTAAARDRAQCRGLARTELITLSSSRCRSGSAPPRSILRSSAPGPERCRGRTSRRLLHIGQGSGRCGREPCLFAGYDSSIGHHSVRQFSAPPNEQPAAWVTCRHTGDYEHVPKARHRPASPLPSTVAARHRTV